VPHAELHRRRQDTKLEMALGLCLSFWAAGQAARPSPMAVSVDGLSDGEFAEAGTSGHDPGPLAPEEPLDGEVGEDRALREGQAVSPAFP
jgi:hypothetical protein